MKPNFNDAVYFFQKGKIDIAEKICLEILNSDPKNLINLNLLGIILFKKKKFTKAIEIIKNSIKINPNQAEAYNNLGIMHIELKKFNDAIIYLNKAVQIKPNFTEAYNNLGMANKEINEYEIAIKTWKKVISLDSNNFQAYNNIGNILMETKKEDLAIEYYQEAIKINNKFYVAFFNLGNVFQRLNLPKESIYYYDKSIEINPNYAEAYYNRGNSYSDLNLLRKSLNDYSKAYSINPNLKNLFGNIVSVKSMLCEWSNYSDDLIFLKNQIENGINIINPFAALALFDSSSIQKKISTNHIFEKQKIYGNKSNFNRKIFNAKIKLAYFSSDFKIHPVSHLIAGMFEQHDKSKFELYAFSLSPIKKDKMYERIFSVFDHFIDVSSKSTEQIVNLSRELNIDIAIDLMGYTKLNRYEIFLKRVAPIQINYLGYSGTFGSSNMDYIIADRNLIVNQNNFSEKIIYLPESFMVTDFKGLNLRNTLKREDYGISNNAFVFCCFNKQYKITPKIFDIWIKLLRKINNSVLWLKINNEEAKLNIQKELEKKGLDPKQIIFAENIDLEDHLSRYNIADLFLDTFPYGAHTTCVDSLWSGLPVLTRRGDSFASRVSSSLLNALELNELIANSDDEYEKIAIDLASNREKLKKIKNKLLYNKENKNLFKTNIFTKNFERSLEIVYKRYINNIKPDNTQI